jgi:glutathione S-transferase
MAEAQRLILHHYPNSPFAEKIRLILGSKSLHWSSVLIPLIMPKPDLVALTGGYRKTPVLQIGADIYCDTALIADVLESIAPEPSLYPSGVSGASRTLAQWADSTLFWAAIPYTMQPAGLPHVFSGMPPEFSKTFFEDRNIYRANLPRMRGPEARSAFSLYLERLEEMIGKQSFFFGSRPSIADFSIYHCLWFAALGGPQAAILDPFRQLRAWRERMRTFGHGTHDQLDSGAAISIAGTAVPSPSTGVSGDVHGIGLGERVVIAATDTGVDPIEGRLYAQSGERISIERSDPHAGRTVVHFPRLGFELRRLTSAAATAPP